MTEQEKGRCPNERPLYLYIQGHTKHNINCMYSYFLLQLTQFKRIVIFNIDLFIVAIQKINEIIKMEHQSSLNRPSRFTNAPPPLMSLHTGVPSVVSPFGIIKENYSLYVIIICSIRNN